MAVEELSQSNNNINELVELSDFNYENIFNMYKVDDFYAFNILKTINLPEDLAPEHYDWVMIDRKMSWANLSFLEYGTIKLWWLICLTNNIQNPVQFPAQGIRVKVINKRVVPQILRQIRSALIQ